jgi:hypothetical protein
VADKSEKYKRLYENWISKKAKQLISTMAAAQPPQILSEDEAKEIVAKTMVDEWKKSAEYKKLQRDSETGLYATQTVTTTNRFTEMLTKKRAARIIEENPGTTEEAAFAEAEKDVLKRETDDKTNVSESADPVAAKILTNISSILMDISEDVIAIRESGPSGLDAAEAAREKEKSPLGKFEKKVKEVESFFERLAKVVSVFLIPVFLGFASKFIDFTDSFGLLKAAVVGFVAYLGSRLLFAAIIKSLSVLFIALGKALIAKVLNIPSTPTIPGTTPVPGGTSIPGPATGGPAGKTTKSISVLTTLGKGIKDLGAGIGAAIASFFQGFAIGLAAFGNPMTQRGIATIILATAALAGLAYFFKQGGLKSEDFLTVGAGLVTLAGGLWVLSRAIPAALLIVASAKPLALALGIVAGAIALLGAALIPGAYAFNLFGEALKLASEGTEKMVDNLLKLTEIDVDALYKIGPALMSVGLGFAAFNAAMAVGALAGIGQSIASFFGADSPIDTVLNFAKDAADADIVGAANAVDQLTKSLQKLSSLELDNLNQIGEGLTSLSLGMGAFAVSGVVSGLGNLVTGFLSKITGQKTPIEQIQELAKDSKSIYDAGRGVESIGKGLTSFNSIDPDKITRTIEYLDNLDDAKLQRLAAIGTQQAQTQQLAGAREQAQSAKTSQVATAQNNVVQQNAVNNSSVNFSSPKMGSAVQGDALAAT